MGVEDKAPDKTAMDITAVEVAPDGAVQVIADPQGDEANLFRSFAGFDVVIENPAGSTRYWRDMDGHTSGSTLMTHDYGFIDGVVGSDDDEVDCYLGPNEAAPFVYVVHQLKAPDFKQFDEDKVMLGFDSEADAKAAFLAHRNDGESAYGGMSAIPVETFRRKLMRRTGSGKIRHGRVLFAGDTIPFSFRDPASAIGKWSRGATFGYKPRGDIDFTPENLSELVRYLASRGDKVSLCQDHKSAFVSKTGQPAPSLGFFWAMAVFRQGELVEHWAWDNGAPPDGMHYDGSIRDGLYCRLGEVTPLGVDSKEGLANYGYLSPMFEVNAVDDKGNVVPIYLVDFAATSSPYQSNCPIEFAALSGAGGVMDEMMKKLGFADGATPTVAEKMAKFAQYFAMGDASSEDLKKMAEVLEKEEDEAAKKMAAQFRRFSEPAAAPVAMDQTLDLSTPAGQAQNAAIHLKTGNVHDEGGRKHSRTAEAGEAQAMSALYDSLAARGVQLPPKEKATTAVLMSLAAIAPAPSIDEAKVADIVAAQIRKHREDELAAARKTEGERLIKMARDAKAPAHEVAALTALVSVGDIDSARASVKKYETPSSPTYLFDRMTAMGGPVGADPKAARGSAVAPAPSIKRTKSGAVFVSADAQIADAAKELEASKDPVIMARIDEQLTADERKLPWKRLIIAQRLAEEMHPDLAAAAHDMAIGLRR